LRGGFPSPYKAGFFNSQAQGFIRGGKTLLGQRTKRALRGEFSHLKNRGKGLIPIPKEKRKNPKFRCYVRYHEYELFSQNYNGLRR